jgi:hypothetical protein
MKNVAWWEDGRNHPICTHLIPPPCKSNRQVLHCTWQTDPCICAAQIGSSENTGALHFSALAICTRALHMSTRCSAAWAPRNTEPPHAGSFPKASCTICDDCILILLEQSDVWLLAVQKTVHRTVVYAPTWWRTKNASTFCACTADSSRFDACVDAPAQPLEQEPGEECVGVLLLHDLLCPTKDSSSNLAAL